MNCRPVGMAHLNDTLFVGGAERQILEQLRIVDRRAWRPHVAALHNEGELVDMLRDLDVPLGRFPLRWGLEHPNTAVQIWRMAAWFKANDIRVVLAHDFYANVIGAAAARLAGIKFVAQRLDLSNWLSTTQKALLGVACRSADLVVVNSHLLVERVAREERVDPARIRVVHNGVNLDAFDAMARAPLEKPLPDTKGLPRVVCVGNMHLPDKGQGDLLEAAAWLKHNGRPIHVVLVGDGAQRALLQARAYSLDIAESVSFLGRRRDVATVLAQCDVGCHPSWAEGLPNAVMEEMAARLPVVATAVGGCPELVDDRITGLLVPPRQPVALARALARVLDGNGGRMGVAGRARLRARFGMDLCVDKYCAVLREALGQAEPAMEASAATA